MQHLLSIALVALISSNLLGQNLLINEVYSAILCSDGSIYSSGNDGNVQNISGGNSTVYRKTSLIDNVKAISGGVGSGNVLFLLNNKTVVATGNNPLGVLGTDSPWGSVVSFKPVLGLTDVIEVSCSGSHSLFLKSDGTVWGIGDSNKGQLGSGFSIDFKTPYQIIGISNVKAVAAGYNTSLFLKNDGTVWACGDNTKGNLALQEKTTYWNPQQITSLSNVSKIVTSGYSSFFILNDGTVYSIGYNIDGQLGIGSFSNYISTPTKVIGLNNVKDISTGRDCCSQQTLFLLENGTVASCGTNSSGELGDGTLVKKNTATIIAGLSDVQYIHAGVGNSIFSKTDGTFSVVGANYNGQLGTGNKISSTTLVNYQAPCNLLITSSDELSAANDLTLYPNPSTGLLNINGKIGTAANPIQVKVYNLSSALVYAETLNPSANSIDLSLLPSGMYFVQFIDGSAIIASEKVVLE